MTFDYGATVKNLTLTFCPKNFFEVNIDVEKPGKNLGQKVNVKFFMTGPILERYQTATEFSDFFDF